MKFKLLSFLILGLVLCSPVLAATYTSQYPPNTLATYVNATTKLGTLYYANLTTNPALPLTGLFGGNQWLSSATPNRFNIDLGSEKIIRRIYYENSHSSGAATSSGVYHFTMYGSNSASSFSDVTYATGTGWNSLTTSQSTFDQHIASNTADPKYITVNNSVLYRYYSFKFEDNYLGDANMGVRRIELQTEDGYDPIPANSISNLTIDNTTNCQNNTASWSNPTDTDFNLVMWWENNIPISNTTNSTTSFTRSGLLSSTSYTYSSHTVDLKGNVNTTWVNNTAITNVCPTPTPTPTPAVTEAIPVYSNKYCGIENLYFSDVRNDNTSYGTLLNFATGSFNSNENVTVAAGDKPKYIDGYLSPVGSPGLSLLLAGLRQYNIYGSVSSLSQPSYYTFNVSIKHANGSYSSLYNTTSTAISTTTGFMDKTYYVSPKNMTFASSDQLLIEIYGYTTRTSATTIYFLNGGTTTASYVQSGYFVCAGNIPYITVYSWRRIA